MKEKREFLPAAGLPRGPVPGLSGQHQRLLAGDKSTHTHSRMLRFDPGTVTPETVVHDIWEEVWTREGSLHDLRLNQTLTAGMYARRPPGMPHGRSDTVGGCTTLEGRYADGQSRQ